MISFGSWITKMIRRMSTSDPPTFKTQWIQTFFETSKRTFFPPRQRTLPGFFRQYSWCLGGPQVVLEKEGKRFSINTRTQRLKASLSRTPLFVGISLNLSSRFLRGTRQRSSVAMRTKDRNMR